MNALGWDKMQLMFQTTLYNSGNSNLNSMVSRAHFKDVFIFLCKGILDLNGLMLSGLGGARAILKLHLHYNMN